MSMQNNNQNKILDFMRSENQPTTIKEISREFNISYLTAYRNMTEMRDQKKIKIVGINENKEYLFIINERFNSFCEPIARLPRKLDETDKRILSVFRKYTYPISAYEIGLSCNKLSKQVINKKLKKLESYELIVFTGVKLNVNGIRTPCYQLNGKTLKSLQEYDWKDYLGRPIWDDVKKKYFLLYEDKEMFWLQDVENKKYEFHFVVGRYYPRQEN